MIDQRVGARITAERQRQKDIHGDKPRPNLVMMSILTEEVGEVAQEVLRTEFRFRDPYALAAELTQVAAVAVAWIEQLLQDGEIVQ